MILYAGTLPLPEPLARRSCPKNSQLSAAILRDSQLRKNTKPQASEKSGPSN